jgi:hypothetical protein
MTPDDQGPEQSQKAPEKKAKHAHERWHGPQGAAQAPRSWTNKTMHHPATRIGEIRHGK